MIISYVDLIQPAFLQFLEGHYHKDKTLLLALSGGPDSMALFHLLRDSQIPFEVAHVHHGWRKESDEEAQLLRRLCLEKEIAYHEKRLLPPTTSANLENEAREARFSFLKELFDKGFYQAVLLAHHADDVAETVLKRVFEGATLSHIRGPQRVSLREGVVLWRPLIEIRKEEILVFLGQRGISYFLDATNDDPKFLRSRLRKEIFPYLSSLFGKEIAPSLKRLSKNSSELHEFLEQFLQEFRAKTKHQEGVAQLDLSEAEFKTIFEWKAVVRDFFEREKMTLSNPVLEAIVAHLKAKSVKKAIKVGSKSVKMDRGNLFLFL